MHQKSIFIFHRALRLTDNEALTAAFKLSKQVLPIFIFDPRQISSRNKYLSQNALQFMLESLQELNTEINQAGGRLYFFEGKTEAIVKKLISTIQVEAVFINRDYTPFSKERDQNVQNLCHKHKIEFQQFNDYLLTNPDQIKNQSGSNYKVFTAFYKRALSEPVVVPQTKPRLSSKNFYKPSLSFAVSLTKIIKQFMPKNHALAVNGGRSKGLKILAKFKKFKYYASTKDFPAIATTQLSAHLKFGTISIREAFYKIIKTFGPKHELLRQLYWRDFFTYIAYHSPEVFGSAFNPKYEDIRWISDKAKFKLWCEGKTGFPIVDAGMRELNQTGFMPNRVRMITASFLVKDLHINWQLGEQYFATKLVDYDPAVNNGNWQWVASTGADAQPYFRIFNPWIQQKKFDAECTYIKQWIPELKNIESKVIHNWQKKYLSSSKYPKPILDHSIEAKKAIKMY